MPDTRPMQAYKVLLTIPETRRLEIVLPLDAPAGPAEVIVLIPRGDLPAVIPWPSLCHRPDEVPAVAQPAREAEPYHAKQHAGCTKYRSPASR